MRQTVAGGSRRWVAATQVAYRYFCLDRQVAICDITSMSNMGGLLGSGAVGWGVAVALCALVGCESAAPACQAPPGTACAVITPLQPLPPRGECPGPADDMGGIGCDPLADDCICGHPLPNGGGASGACHAGVCVDVDGGSQ